MYVKFSKLHQFTTFDIHVILESKQRMSSIVDKSLLRSEELKINNLNFSDRHVGLQGAPD